MSEQPHPVETKWFHEFVKEIPYLSGKTVVITGTTSGTGFIVARTAIRKGADNVLLVNRLSERASKAEAELKAEPNAKNVETIPCDLQDLSSVQKAADAIKAKYDSVDVLCNNAGVMALEDKATKDGYDVQMQTNHLSHFLLTKELYPLLKKAAELRGSARIANHSSGLRRFPPTPLKEEYFGKNGGNLGGDGNKMGEGARWERYHQSKLANAVFSMALNDRLGSGSKVMASAAAPGLAATNLQLTTNQDGGMGDGMGLMEKSQSAEDGTMSILNACFSAETKPGMIWEPQGLVGPSFQSPMDELSATVEFRDMLWKASEVACGAFISGSKPHDVETKWFPEFEKSLPELSGKTVAVTGTTSGTGYIVARTAIRKGADNVLLLNRPSDRATKAETELKAEPNAKNVETIPCDLQDFGSVKNAAATIKSKYDSVDVLCNNAGVMALEDKATKDGYDVQIQTNHLSHFLLTKELYPLLQKAAELRGSARIANHTSSARYGGVPLKEEYFGKNGGNLGGDGSNMLLGGGRWLRYHQSKLANAVYSMALNDRLGSDSKILAACADPGLAATNLQVTTNSNGGMGGNMWIMRFSQSAEDGTMPILSACFSPETKAGTIWAPKSGWTGPAVQNPTDKLSATPELRDLLWKVSEEACGKFDI
eukprot:Nitzschia sp. Nitz4//scaffold60_size111251//107820//110271//NITZ4_004168-RA/size111251-snap-gene-0.200-mRNA-1//-1//CDS//3329555627//2892//frame0